MKVVVAETGKSSPKSCIGSITINLENLNDESPQFMAISPNPLTINESLPWGTLLIKVSATDRDVDDVIYYEFVKAHAGFLIEEARKLDIRSSLYKEEDSLMFRVSATIRSETER
ncbi:cadherin EGF LAG seven-pass G-type receptor fmi-1-like [Heptranchias perlo]|uniref:cadherin EGF LAG seven-pass G-type receptor fmi-1-like n=1 Tax=Heptranchias perlo TaxID=212740 RepID=UPI00355A5C35